MKILKYFIEKICCQNMENMMLSQIDNYVIIL